MDCTLQIVPSRLGGVARTIVLQPAICAGYKKNKQNYELKYERKKKEILRQQVIKKATNHAYAYKIIPCTTASIRAVDGRTAVPPGT